ncbi:diacylglycerol/lipid kinase family protein [Lentibacillus sediminis]|uniref:diacylglycerol/lipid kinase family protein n=1 Tax=Lentibacillus sediminis TaxID=1940529 RepID=UPI000C1B84C5|nr:diacylglycerol kinase family protein [Lentibacillus sediminis]
MPKYRKGLFLYNGNAGNNNIEQNLKLTLPVLAQAIKELTVIQTASEEEAQESCRTFAKDIDILIILGGDGTVNACINSLAPLEKRPAVAILPGGTSNDFSRMLGIPQQLEQAAYAIVRGEPTAIDIGKTGEKYFLNFWGIGLVADTSQNIDDDQKRSFGVFSYIMSTLRTVSQTEPFPYEITTGEQTYTGEAVMVIVLNGKFLGTRELPVPTIDPSDGKFDVLIVKDSTIATFRELLSMNNPNTEQSQLSDLEHFQTDKLTVAADHPKSVDMDGEITGSTPAEIEVLPGHIQLIQAPAFS